MRSLAIRTYATTNTVIAMTAMRISAQCSGQQARRGDDPVQLAVLHDGDQRTRNRAMSAATSMIVSSALAAGTSMQVLGQHVAHRLAAQLLGRMVGPRLVDHTGQRRIVLDVGRHDEPHHLRCGQHGVRLPGRVGDDDPRQTVLGEHACRIQCVGVDGYHREFLGHVLGMHISSTIQPRPEDVAAWLRGRYE